MATSYNGIKQIYVLKRTPITVLVHDRWQYNRKNWFTDILWKLLHKTGSLYNAIGEEEITDRIEINTNKLLKLAWQQILNIEYYEYRQPKHIYFGQDALDEIKAGVGTNDIHNAIDFDAPMSYTISSVRRIYNIPCTYVPHMDGLLVV